MGIAFVCYVADCKGNIYSANVKPDVEITRGDNFEDLNKYGFDSMNHTSAIKRS